MDTQLAETNKETALSTKVEDLSNWGDGDISSQDIIIPMFLMMQYMSEKVRDQVAKFGEIRDSLENKLFAEKGQELEIIPFFLEKYWVEYTIDSNGKNKTFKDKYAVTPANERQSIQEPGLVRDYVWAVYCLLPNDIDGLPFVFPFRRTSAKAGRFITTQMYVRNKKAGKNPAAYTLKIKTNTKEGNDGEYAVAEVVVGRETTKDEQLKCLEWLRTIKSGDAKADESDLHSGPEEAAVNEDAGQNQREY